VILGKQGESHEVILQVIVLVISPDPSYASIPQKGDNGEGNAPRRLSKQVWIGSKNIGGDLIQALRDLSNRQMSVPQRNHRATYLVEVSLAIMQNEKVKCDQGPFQVNFVRSFEF
jgi:hypothetical protein